MTELIDLSSFFSPRLEIISIWFFSSLICPHPKFGGGNYGFFSLSKTQGGMFLTGNSTRSDEVLAETWLPRSLEQFLPCSGHSVNTSQVNRCRSAQVFLDLFSTHAYSECFISAQLPTTMFGDGDGDWWVGGRGPTVGVALRPIQTSSLTLLSWPWSAFINQLAPSFFTLWALMWLANKTL